MSLASREVCETSVDGRCVVVVEGVQVVHVYWISRVGSGRWVQRIGDVQAAKCARSKARSGGTRSVVLLYMA